MKENLEQIKNQIFNLTKDKVTVKEVAEICKKYSPNTKLFETNDEIPNLGFTLSNKKILKTGFKFLYNIDQNIKEMIDKWSKQNLIKGIILKFCFSVISFRDWPDTKDIYPGIKGKTHGDKKLINPAPKAIKYSIIYPVFFIAAEIPAIDVIKASSKYFLSKFLYFLIVNLFIIFA